MDGLAHARRCALVVGTVTGTHANMPLLLTEACLPAEMFDADGTSPAQSSGGDIRFSSDLAGTTALPCEIVLFTTDNNPALGTARIWVKVPSVATGTTFYVWYNTVATDSQPAVGASNGRNAVWSDYAFVSHALSVDSTGSAANSTISATALVPGPFGDANGGHAFGTTLAGSNNSLITTAYIGSNTIRSMQIWAFCRALGTIPRVWAKSSEFGLFGVGSGGGDLRVVNNWSSANESVDFDRIDGAWFNITTTYTGAATTTHSIPYTNGVVRSTIGLVNGAGTINSNANPVLLGNLSGLGNCWDGSLAEFRIRHSILSANWIATEYANQNTPGSFIAEGTPESTAVLETASTTAPATASAAGSGLAASGATWSAAGTAAAAVGGAVGAEASGTANAAAAEARAGLVGAKGAIAASAVATATSVAEILGQQAAIVAGASAATAIGAAATAKAALLAAASAAAAGPATAQTTAQTSAPAGASAAPAAAAQTRAAVSSAGNASSVQAASAGSQVAVTAAVTAASATTAGLIWSAVAQAAATASATAAALATSVGTRLDAVAAADQAGAAAEVVADADEVAAYAGAVMDATSVSVIIHVGRIVPADGLHHRLVAADSCISLGAVATPAARLVFVDQLSAHIVARDALATDMLAEQLAA